MVAVGNTSHVYGLWIRIYGRMDKEQLEIEANAIGSAVAFLKWFIFVVLFVIFWYFL